MSKKIKNMDAFDLALNQALKEAYIPKELRKIFKITTNKQGIAEIKLIKKRNKKEKMLLIL